MIRITAPRGPDDFDTARQLGWEYRDFLLTMPEPHKSIVQTVYAETAYAEVMAALETRHSPPHGGLRLVFQDTQTLGCGMFHTLEPGIAEIKRVFLRPEARGLGAGRALMDALVAACRDQGFSMIRLDTATPLETARALYLEMGFRERDAYYDVPDIARGQLVFFEMDL